MSNPYTMTRNPAVDMSDLTVVDGFDDRSWDMVGSLNLSLQLPTGSVLLELADKGHDEIVVCTADLGRPTRSSILASAIRSATSTSALPSAT